MSHDYAAASYSCNHLHGLSLSLSLSLSRSLPPAGARRDRTVGAISRKPPCPPRFAPGTVDRSPVVSSLRYHHTQQHPHNGAHKTTLSTPPPHSHPCGSEGFVSRLFQCLELMAPLLLTHCNIVWRAWPLLPPNWPAGPLGLLAAACPVVDSSKAELVP